MFVDYSVHVYQKELFIVIGVSNVLWFLDKALQLFWNLSAILDYNVLFSFGLIHVHM